MSWTEPEVVYTGTVIGPSNSGNSTVSGAAVYGSSVDLLAVRTTIFAVITCSAVSGTGSYVITSFEGSLDGSSWYGISGSFETTEVGVAGQTVTGVARYLRVVLTPETEAYQSGASLTVSVSIVCED